MIVIDSESCFGEMEHVWAAENLGELEGMGRALMHELILERRRRIEEHGGSVRLVWVPSHVGIYPNAYADAVPPLCRSLCTASAGSGGGADARARA